MWKYCIAKRIPVDIAKVAKWRSFAWMLKSVWLKILSNVVRV